VVRAQFDNRRLIALARAQHGVVARSQLAAPGMTSRRIAGRLGRGDLVALHRGVYLVGPTSPARASEMAAVLACGPTARVSHDSATYLYGFLPHPADPGPIHITVTERHCRRRPGIHLHRTTGLAPHETRERDGIPVTAPIRTLIDFAVSASHEALEAAVAEAFALHLVGRGQILRELDRIGSRPGSRPLRRLLEGPRRPQRTRSAPERKLLVLIRAAGLPEPEANVRIGGWEVDLLWRDERLIVEVDGYAAHSSPRAFERDRRKTAALQALGYVVLRVTPRQIAEHTGAVIAWIQRALADPDNGVA
jgi:very-short-patch-repair endonuclease